MYTANSVQILGDLSNDPEITTTETGKKCARFSMNGRDAYVNGEGKRVETTESIIVVAFEGNAAIVEKYLVKGKQIAIAGRIQTREYTDANGDRKWITEVVATDILLLGTPKSE